MDPNRKQADERARHLVLHTASLWGHRDPAIPCNVRRDIAKAACRQVACDLGHFKALAHTQLPSWHAKVFNQVAGGESSDPLSPSHSGRRSNTASIEKEHEEHIGCSFRYAQKVRGPLETLRRNG